MDDRDISDSEWNKYLLKFRDKYFVKKDDGGIYQIECLPNKLKNNIQLYSIKNRELCYVGGDGFKTTQGKNSIFKKMPSYCTVTQEGDIDFVIKFPEDKLSELEDLFKIKKHYKKSKRQIEIATANLLKYREEHKND